MKCRLVQCEIEARSRGLCPKHYKYFREYNCLHLFEPMRVPRPPCTFRGCSDAHYAKGYCESHYTKFVKAKYIAERPKRKCKRCKRMKNILARGLCENCYRGQYDKVAVHEATYANIELAIQLSNINGSVTAKLWHREFPELSKEASDRTFERVKKAIRDFKIPMAVDGDKYTIDVPLRDLKVYLKNRFKHEERYGKLEKKDWLPARNGRNKGRKLK